MVTKYKTNLNKDIYGNNANYFLYQTKKNKENIIINYNSQNEGFI